MLQVMSPRLDTIHAFIMIDIIARLMSPTNVQFHANTIFLTGHLARPELSCSKGC